MTYGGKAMLTWAIALCSLLTIGQAASPVASGGASSSGSSSESSSSSSGSNTNYPVFGTKRYARSNLLPSSEYQGGQGLSLPVYHLPNARYYDTQLPPQYFPFAPYQAPSSSDYYDDGGYYGDAAKSYYYLPQPQHRRYQRNNERYTSYGLPTYRGEYKPTPYYYAHGPSYSYSDDHESSNPLDDLHEEMLQEDERERARDYYPVGQEQWYESPSRQDSAFLRNLIMYNSQLQNYGGGRGRQMAPMEGSNEEDFEEYDDTEPDYEYDVPLGEGRPSGYGNFFGDGYPTDGGPSPSSRNTFNKLNSFRNSMAKNQIAEDDEEVQELKSLIHQQKSSSQRLPPMLMDKMAPFLLKAQQYPSQTTDPVEAIDQKQQLQQQQQQQQQQDHQLRQRQSKQQYQQLQPQQQKLQQQQQHQQLQQEQRLQLQQQLQQQQLAKLQQQQQHQQLQQQQRLQLQQQLQQQQQQRQQQLLLQQRQKEQQQQELLLEQQKLQAQEQQLQKEQKQQQLLRTLSSDYQPAYEADNWQKDSPSYGAAYDYDENEYDDSWSHWDRKRNVQPKKATFAGKSTTAATVVTSSTKKPQKLAAHKSPSTSTVASVVTSKPVVTSKTGNGQKEVVLPRPTNPRNLFAANLIQAVDETRMQKNEDGTKHKEPRSSKIYDALKAMMSMQQDQESADLRQQLEHQKQLAHIHKRFVSNEESLVQQLDGLKRSA